MLVQAGLAAVLLVALFVGLAYRGRAYWAWALALGGALIGWGATGVASPRLFAAAVALFLVTTVVLSLLMVSNVRFRSFKDLRLNTGTIALVLFTIGSSAFVWRWSKPQFVLVWLLSVYILIGFVETVRVLAARLTGHSRDSVPPQAIDPL